MSASSSFTVTHTKACATENMKVNERGQTTEGLVHVTARVSGLLK